MADNLGILGKWALKHSLKKEGYNKCYKAGEHLMNAAQSGPFKQVTECHRALKSAREGLECYEKAKKL